MKQFVNAAYVQLTVSKYDGKIVNTRLLQNVNRNSQ